jgi:2-polyprenyl-3-methyl-5-hydroxy-6-metoxy-1,4-benzoquinol methylase
MTLAASSFRDPAGRCFVLPHSVYRFLDEDSARTCESFLESKCARSFVSRGQLISTKRLGSAETALLQSRNDSKALFASHNGQIILEHERIPFASYPCEWAPEMLWEAGRLTLELAQSALVEGYGLKDATPYNVLYRGAEPVFVDVPSFEQRDASDPVWLAQGQFVRTFLLPLLANQRWGLALADIFMTHRDGLEPEDIYRWCGFVERFQPGIFSLVSMPTWLKGKAQAEGGRLYETRRMNNPEKARFILQSLLKRTERTLESVKPKSRGGSGWTAYMETHSYSEPAFADKEKFVDEVLREIRPKRVLDVGANTGHFSLCAAKAGAEVVAIDSDPACVGRISERARKEKVNVLPLVVNLARPTPALGWRNGECGSFLERSRGGFDCVLMLAVVHHLLVTERIPLEEILRLVAELTTQWLVIEFVEPQDEMFRQLTRGRDALHAGLSEKKFEEACTEDFDIVRSLALAGKARWMYLLKRKGRDT